MQASYLYGLCSFSSTMDPFIIAAIISAIVIVILSFAFIRIGSQVKPQGTFLKSIS